MKENNDIEFFQYVNRFWKMTFSEGSVIAIEPIKEEFQTNEALNDWFEKDYRVGASFFYPIKLLGTQYQKEVWVLTKEIPFGQTLTYQALAECYEKKYARHTHPRAIAQALARNPLMLIVPCHRVVAKNGLGGFQGALHSNELKSALIFEESSDSTSLEMSQKSAIKCFKVLQSARKCSKI